MVLLELIVNEACHNHVPGHLISLSLCALTHFGTTLKLSKIKWLELVQIIQLALQVPKIEKAPYTL